MGWHSVVLPLVVLLAAGCAVSTAELRDSLDLNQASFQDKLAGRQVLIDEFADWTGTSYRRLDLHKLRKVVDVIRQWHGHVDFDEDALAEDGSRFAQLLLA